MDTDTQTANNFVQKRFEKLEDFNLIYINDFQRENIPSIISGNFLKKFPEKIKARSFLFFNKMVDNNEIPSEVLASFNSGLSIVSHEGIVYKKTYDSETGLVCYESFEDATERINNVLEIDQIKNSINALELGIRKPALSRDLLELQGFNLIESEYGDVSLSLKDDVAIEKLSPLAKNTRNCKLVLTVIKNGYLISLDLGVLTYSVYRKN